MTSDQYRAMTSLIDSISLQNRSIEQMREAMQQGNQEVSQAIAQVGRELGGKIDDLAAQIGIQSQSIDRLERSIERLAEESRQHNETAKLQAQNVAELIKTVQQMAIARG